MTARRDPRFLAGVAALALLAVALVAPAIPTRRPIFDVVAAIDITGSMNTRDVRDASGARITRLALGKAALRRLVTALPCGSRLGLALFVETRAFVLFDPVETCGNYPVLDAAIDGIDWRMGWDSESHIELGVHDAMIRAARLGADLIFLTDGQEVPPTWWTGSPSFAALRGRVGGVLGGLGGLEFVPIPKFDQDGRQIGFWKPGEVPSERGGLFRGREHLTALDEPHLRALEAQTGLGFLRVDSADALLPGLRRAVRPRLREGTLATWPVPTGLALLLLAGRLVPGAVWRRPGRALSRGAGLSVGLAVTRS